jgi:hypothetical protein
MQRGQINASIDGCGKDFGSGNLEMSSNIRLCVFDDKPTIRTELNQLIDYIVEGLEIDKSVGQELNFEGEPVSQYDSFCKLRAAIKTWKGPLIGVIDFNFGLDAIVRSQLQNEVIVHRLGPNIAADIRHRIDGLVLGTDLISNKLISPLMLVVATSEGYIPGILSSLNTYKMNVRPNKETNCTILWHDRIFGTDTFENALRDRSLSDYCRLLRQVWDRWQNPEEVRASTLTASQWNSLRQSGRNICSAIYEGNKDFLHSPKWLHHAPDGGIPIPDNRYNEVCNELKEYLGQSFVWINDLNSATWPQNPDWHEGAPPRLWDQLPVRALVQFTSDGSDMRQTLSFLDIAVQALIEKARTMGIALTIDNRITNFDSWPTQDLWFNVPALCEGLWQLTDGLLVADRRGTYIQVLWSSEIRTDPSNGDCLCIITYQQDIKSSTEGNSKPINLPPLGDPKPRAYGFFRNAGGHIQTKEDKLICTIRGIKVDLGPDFKIKVLTCAVPETSAE